MEKLMQLKTALLQTENITHYSVGILLTLG